MTGSSALLDLDVAEMERVEFGHLVLVQSEDGAGARHQTLASADTRLSCIVGL